MTEYIDREAAFHKLKHFIAQDWFHSIELHAMCQYETCNPTEFARGYEQGALDAATVITGYPAADVVEVKHGRWIPAAAYNDGKINTVYCSECMCYQPIGEWDYYDFCVFCGAKMEAE